MSDPGDSKTIRDFSNGCFVSLGWSLNSDDAVKLLAVGWKRLNDPTPNPFMRCNGLLDQK